MYFTPACESSGGFKLFFVIIRRISALDRIPEVPVHSPGSAPLANGHLGVLHDGSAKVKDLP